MTKRFNPYTDLREQCQKWAAKVCNARVVFMWRYPKEKLSAQWSVADLYERTAAAAQLGYDVRMRATDDGLIVEYVARPPSPPWRIAP